ncbi:MAG: hypothetical protein Q8R78_06785 [Candidatus Omnitrophota bacterium]|nr:hypothetical protein [Candidatus Omnitrophota bacterium]
MPPGLKRLLVGTAALFAVSATALADEPVLTDDEVVVRTEGAHRLLLPKDWPVEEREGRIVQASLVDYLSMKFGQVAARLDEVNRRLEMIERQVQHVEDELKTTQLRVKLLEATQHASEPHEGR